MIITNIELAAAHFMVRVHLEAKLDSRMSEQTTAVLDGSMRRTLSVHVLAHSGDQIVVPSDWFQALKDRWLPKFCRGRWPVRHTTYTPWEMFPAVDPDSILGSPAYRVEVANV